MPFHAAFSGGLPDLNPQQSPINIPAPPSPGGGLGGLASSAIGLASGASLGGAGGIDAGSAVGDTTLGAVNFQGGTIGVGGDSMGLLVVGAIAVAAIVIMGRR